MKQTQLTQLPQALKDKDLDATCISGGRYYYKRKPSDTAVREAYRAKFGHYPN